MPKDFVDVYGFLCGKGEATQDATRLVEILKRCEREKAIEGLWLPTSCGIIPFDKEERPEYLDLMPETRATIQEYAQHFRQSPNDHFFLARARVINYHKLGRWRDIFLKEVLKNPDTYQNFEVTLSKEVIQTKKK